MQTTLLHGHVRLASLCCAVVALFAACSPESRQANPPPPNSTRHVELSGVVRDVDGPLAGARVRLKGRSEHTITDDEGNFQITVGDDGPLHVTASKAGYFINGGPAQDGPVMITLQRHPIDDFRDYCWVDPTPNPDEPHQCGNCHGEIYAEWQTSAHSRSVVGHQLQNLYDGSNWSGGRHGWSLLDEHPDGAGVCAACHAPSIEPFGPEQEDLRLTDGVARHGVHCDFCHKIFEVETENIGLSHGSFAMRLARPQHGQLFFGPLDDVDRGEDVFSPLQSSSRICASCHEGVVFGVHVYSTYSEYLASSAYENGRQCQSCHMTPTGKMTNIAPDAGGIQRDPQTLASHSFMPGGRGSMLQHCLKLAVVAERTEIQGIRLIVDLTTDDVGHMVPTGFIDRHVMLVVEAVDEDGNNLAILDGPQLPAAVGPTYAERPGRLFAKLLRDPDGNSPVPFWTTGAEFVDTRLPPDEVVRTVFHFPQSAHRAEVRLIYRRFWESVATSKSWPDDSIIIARQNVLIAQP